MNNLSYSNGSDDDQAMDIALWKYGLIAPALNGLHLFDSNMAYFRHITEQPLASPDNQVVTYNPKTLEKWKSDYLHGGLDALAPSTRSDKGTSRKLDEKCAASIKEMIGEFPRISATLIHGRLLDQSLIETDTNVRTVQRFVKQLKLTEGIAPDGKDRMAFEHKSFGVMYQADTSYLQKILIGDQLLQTFLVRILDDHTRLTVAHGVFLEDNAENFQIVLKKAVTTYGVPKLLYVDLGSPYQNRDLEITCAELGTKLIHTPVRDGAAKGKVERSFETLKSRWMYGFDASTVHSLEEYREIIADEIRKANLVENKGIIVGPKIPLDRFNAATNVATLPKSQEWLDEAFMHRINRLVYKDATLRIDNRVFDAPRQFIGLKVEVRYLPSAWEKAYIFFEGKHYPLKLTNKAENAVTKRKNNFSVDYTKANK